MDLVRDVLDKQLVSAKSHDPLGMADDLLLELREGEPPKVVAIESGFPVLARHFHPKLHDLVQFLGHRFGVRRGRIYRIPWSRVKSIGIEIELNLQAETSSATDWERWLRQHVLRHIPGGSR